MAKSVVFSLNKNFVEFEWDGEKLEWRAATQNELDTLEDIDNVFDFAKAQLELRLTGEGKERFLSEAYKIKNSRDLLMDLNDLLEQAKKGK